MDQHRYYSSHELKRRKIMTENQRRYMDRYYDLLQEHNRITHLFQRGCISYKEYDVNTSQIIYRMDVLSLEEILESEDNPFDEVEIAIKKLDWRVDGF